MTQHTLTALFDSRSDANKAVDRLIGSGIDRSAIRVLPEGEDTSYDSTTGEAPYDAGRDDKGFWASLADFFFPDDDRYSYSEALNRGDVMVAVTVSDEDSVRAEDILEEYGTVNLDEREESWRSSGWQGYDRDAMTGASRTGMTSGLGQAGSVAMGDDAMPTSGSRSGMEASRTGMEARSMDSGYSDDDTRDETIPVVEEDLRIGKRRISEGRIKVRSYVVETPVSEDVELRDEEVEVERRPVDRPLTGNEDAFRERTIEAEAMSEKAMVEKTARVKEEIGLKKKVDHHTETVSDSVRSTKVEVDDDRTRRRAGGR